MAKDMDSVNAGAFKPNKIQAERFARTDILKDLGLLGQLAGNWKGHGFNLIARPDFHHNSSDPSFSDLYLQLNHTSDHIQIDPIPGSIPNRGFGQDDINGATGSRDPAAPVA